MRSHLFFISGFDSTRLAWALIHFLWQGLVIGLLLELALASVGRKNASLRYVLCGLALAAMPVCLLDTYFALDHDSYAVAMQPSWAGATAVDQRSSASAATAFALLPVVNSISDFTAHRIPWFDLNRCLPGVVAGWLIGIVLLTGRKAGGFMVLWRLRRRGISAPSDAMCHLCRQACTRIGVNPRRVCLGISNLIQVPMTMGWMRPVILFPAVLLSGLSSGEIELLLAHELAHIRRCDYLVNLAQTVVETLFFYHPVTWWISHRMRQERENSCDDQVATHAKEVLAYAHVLFRLETLRPPGASLVAAANGGSLLHRIRRLADEPAPNGGPGLPILITFFFVLAVTAVGSMAKAQMAFSPPARLSRANASTDKPGTPNAISAWGSSQRETTGTAPDSLLTILYRDNFAREGELEGSAPALVDRSHATWTSTTGSSQYTTSGTKAAMSTSSYAYSMAYLPVNGVSGIKLDGTKDFALSVVVTPGSMGRTGISLNTGTLCRYSNLFTNNFATLSTSSGFAGAYAFNGGTIGYNYLPGIKGPTMISLNYSASTGTLTYIVGSTTVYTQTGVTPNQVASVRYVGMGNDGYSGGADKPAPTFDNFTFALDGSAQENTSSKMARLRAIVGKMVTSL